MTRDPWNELLDRLAVARGRPGAARGLAPPARAEVDDLVRRARAAARKAGMKPADVERAVAKARSRR